MVSVVIPTHNRANLVKRAIESVMRQSYEDIEIIVVSDGSTDNTTEVIDELCSLDGRISFINYYPAKGGNVARNAGIEIAKGEYVAFLDDDDEWMPDKLEKQIEVFESNNEIGLVYTGVNLIYVEDGINYQYLSSTGKQGDLSKEILFENCIGTTSTVMMKKNLFSRCGNFDIEMKALQDYDLWIRVCQKTRIGKVTKPCINYFNYRTNVQISSSSEKYEQANKYLKVKYQNLYSQLSEKEKKIQQVNISLSIANRFMRNNDKKNARKHTYIAMKIKVTKKCLIYYVMSWFNYKTVLKLRRYI